jgi:hypothetical protein
MSQSNRVRITVYVVSAAWSLVLFIAGVQLPHVWAKVLGTLPLLVVVGFAAFDNWVWQAEPVRRLTHRPQLNGTWVGSLTSLHDDDDGHEVAHDPIPIALVIHQSFLAISVLLISEESQSRSISSVLQVSPPNTFTLYYHYDNLPGLLVRDRSARHAGSARLEVSGVSPESLTGEYWTDRRSRGTFSLRKIGKKKCGSWADVQQLEKE